MGALDDARKWFTENKLRAVGVTLADCDLWRLFAA